MQRLSLFIIYIVFVWWSAIGQTEPDSLRMPFPGEAASCFPATSVTQGLYKFRTTQLIAPAAMLAAGVTGIYAFHGVRESFRFSDTHHTTVDRYIQYAPLAAYFGLGFIPGVRTRTDDWRNRLMAGVTAYAIMAVVNNVMKVSFHEWRPDGSTHDSFPSGHTATAFTGAELMRIEYGNLVGVTGYAAAIAVGALRMYNNRHWINDIIGGAAVGILSARAAYWLLPFERRLFGLDKKNTAVALLPLAGEANGISLAVTF